MLCFLPYAVLILPGGLVPAAMAVKREFTDTHYSELSEELLEAALKDGRWMRDPFDGTYNWLEDYLSQEYAKSTAEHSEPARTPPGSPSAASSAGTATTELEDVVPGMPSPPPAWLPPPQTS